MIHVTGYSVRVMAPRKEDKHLDYIALSCKARKLFESIHVPNMSIERVYSFYSKKCKDKFLQQLKALKDAKVV